jgi:SPX domain protein involved in polyphosphate accumulation
MKFSKQLKNSATPEWKSQYICYQYLKKQILNVHRTIEEKQFFDLYENEICKINRFFSTSLAKFASRHEDIMRQVSQMVKPFFFPLFTKTEKLERSKTECQKFTHFSISRTLSRACHASKLPHIKLHRTRQNHFKI